MNMSTKSEFSEYRKASGLTLDAVASQFNVDRTTILRWEKGEPPVPIKRVSEIETVTGIPRGRLRPDVFEPAEAAE